MRYFIISSVEDWHKGEKIYSLLNTLYFTNTYMVMFHKCDP